MSKKLLFIFNPLSGKGQIKNHLVKILDVFVKSGYQVQVHVTQCREDARRVTEKRAARFDLVVCCGGDGTMNETVSGLMTIPEEKRPVLGYIPAGTTNDFAKSLRLPREMVKSAGIAVREEGRFTDIGKLGERFFTYVAGFGAFMDVSYLTPQDMKNVLGHPAYIMEGIKRLPELKPNHVRVEYEGQVLEEEFLLGMVTNSISVAGFKGITGNSVELDDGLFEVVLIRNPKTPVEFTAVLGELIQNDSKKHDFVYRFKTGSIRFISENPLDFVVDGEYGGGHTDITVTICEKALRIIRK